MHMIERYRRPDIGHLDVQLMFDDPVYYTKSGGVLARATQSRAMWLWRPVETRPPSSGSTGPTSRGSTA